MLLFLDFLERIGFRKDHAVGVLEIVRSHFVINFAQLPDQVGGLGKLLSASALKFVRANST